MSNRPYLLWMGPVFLALGIAVGAIVTAGCGSSSRPAEAMEEVSRIVRHEASLAAPVQLVPLTFDQPVREFEFTPSAPSDVLLTVICSGELTVDNEDGVAIHVALVPAEGGVILAIETVTVSTGPGKVPFSFVLPIDTLAVERALAARPAGYVLGVTASTAGASGTVDSLDLTLVVAEGVETRSPSPNIN